MQVYLQVLAFGAFALGCFFLSYGIDESFEKTQITHFIYFLFPLITTFPELTVFAYGLISGNAGTKVAIGTVLGEPFIVMTLGLLAYKLWIKKPLKMDKGSSMSLLTFVFVAGLFLLSSYVFRYISVIMLGLFTVYEYEVLKAFKKEKYENIRRNPLIYTAVGLAILLLTGRYVVDSTINLAELLNVQPSLISFLIIPIISSAPEMISPFVFLKRKEQEQIASLIAELPFAMGVYPGLFMLAESLSVPFPIALGIVFSILQAVFLIYEEKAKKNITLFSSAVFLASFIIILKFL